MICEKLLNCNGDKYSVLANARKVPYHITGMHAQANACMPDACTQSWLVVW